MISPPGTRDSSIPKDLLSLSVSRLASSEYEVLKFLHKDLASRSDSVGINKETFLQYFNLPGLWGERLFRYFDMNGSNYIEFEEFIAGISICCRGTPSEKITVLFHVFDLNEDSVIRKAELVTMLSNFPMMAKRMKPEFNQTLASPSVASRSPSSDNIRAEYAESGLESGEKSSRSVTGYVSAEGNPHEDNKMNIKKLRHDTVLFKSLISSLSKTSFQSALSSECVSRCDTLNNSIQKVNSISTGGRDCNTSTPDSFNGAENAVPSSPPDVNDVKSGISRRESHDSCHEKVMTNRSHSSFTKVDRKIRGRSMSQDFYDSYRRFNHPKSKSANYSDDSDTNKSVAHGHREKVKNCIQGLNEAEMYGKPSPEVVKRIKDSAVASMAATSIIEHENLTEADGGSLDILVESILEECDFNDNGHLDFDTFRVWVRKNNCVLSLFSQYLHEEVWGLRGNAFITSPENLEFFISSIGEVPSRPQNIVNEEEEKIAGSSQLDRRDRVTQRMVYQMFLVNKSEAETFKKCISSLENVVSEEILRYLHHVSDKIQENGRVRNFSKRESMESHSQIASSMKDVLSCPNCATPFFMCPVCFKRHECLSLYIDPEIYIICENCTRNQQETRFTKCWICEWNFSEASQMAITKRRQHKSQLLRRFRYRVRNSPRRGYHGAQSPSKTRKTDETSRRCLMKSSASILHSNSYGNRRLLSRSTTSSIKKNVSLSRDFSKLSLETMSSSIGVTDNGEWPLLRANAPTKAGYMYKRGKHFHKMEKRYYVLVDKLLYYYMDKQSTTPRGCIFLEGCYLNSVAKDKITTMYCLRICQKSKKLNRREFYVSSKTEFIEWVEALSVAMKQQSITQLYTICEQLGHGKFSVVYRAIYKSTGEEFAVKIVDKTKIGDQERELLRSEIAILSLLRNQHVIYLKDVNDTCDSLYIVMELVKGGELLDLINQVHRLSETHTHKIICQLLEIVAYLHKCGIIHRDIKPENILLTDKTEEATIKLTDFGLSTLCGPNEVLKQPCGTLAYVAPEVLTLQGYNQKADVWSIGVIMYLLLRGRLPFSVKYPGSMNMRSHYAVRFDGQYWEGVSTSAKDLIGRMLQVNADDRITVFEALEHVWVKNFVAVNYDEFANNGKDLGAAPDFIHSLRNTTDTTFVIPYSESCMNNLQALQNEAEEQGDKTLSTVVE